MFFVGKGGGGGVRGLEAWVWRRHERRKKTIDGFHSHVIKF